MCNGSIWDCSEQESNANCSFLDPCDAELSNQCEEQESCQSGTLCCWEVCDIPDCSESGTCNLTDHHPCNSSESCVSSTSCHDGVVGLVVLTGGSTMSLGETSLFSNVRVLVNASSALTFSGPDIQFQKANVTVDGGSLSQGEHPINLTGVSSLVAKSSALLKFGHVLGIPRVMKCAEYSHVAFHLDTNSSAPSQSLEVLSGCTMTISGEGIWSVNETILSGSSSVLRLGTELQVGVGGFLWSRDGSSIRQAHSIAPQGVLSLHESPVNVTLHGVIDVDILVLGSILVVDFSPISLSRTAKMGIHSPAAVTILKAQSDKPPSSQCIIEVHGALQLAGASPKEIGCHITLRGPTSSLAVLPGSVPPVLLSPVRVEGSLVLQSGSSMLLQASSSFPPGSSVDIHVNSTLSLTGPVSVQCAASPSATQAVVTVEAGSQWTVDGQLLVEQGARLVHEGSLRGNSSGVVTVQHPQSELRVSGELHNMGELRVGNGSAVVLEASSDPLTCTPFLGMRVDVEGSIAVPLSSFSHCGVAASIGARLLNVSDGGSISTQAGVQWNVDSAHVRGTLTWETSASGQVSVGGDLHLLAGSVVSGHMSVSVGGSIVIPEGGALVRGLTEAMPCVVSGTSASIGMCSVVQNGTGDSVGLSMMEGVRVGVYSRVEVSGVVQMCGPGVELADGTSHVVAGTVEVVQNSTIWTVGVDREPGIVDVQVEVRVFSGKRFDLSSVVFSTNGMHLEDSSLLVLQRIMHCELNSRSEVGRGSSVWMVDGTQCSSNVSTPMRVYGAEGGLPSTFHVHGPGTQLFLPLGSSLSVGLVEVLGGANMTSFGGLNVDELVVSGWGSTIEATLFSDHEFTRLLVEDGGILALRGESSTVGSRFVRVCNAASTLNSSVSVIGSASLLLEGSIVFETPYLLLAGLNSFLSAPKLLSVKRSFVWLGGHLSAPRSISGDVSVVESPEIIVSGSSPRSISLVELRNANVSCCDGKTSCFETTVVNVTAPCEGTFPGNTTWPCCLPPECSNSTGLGWNSTLPCNGTADGNSTSPCCLPVECSTSTMNSTIPCNGTLVGWNNVTIPCNGTGAGWNSSVPCNGTEAKNATNLCCMPPMCNFTTTWNTSTPCSQTKCCVPYPECRLSTRGTILLTGGASVMVNEGMSFKGVDVLIQPGAHLLLNDSGVKFDEVSMNVHGGTLESRMSKAVNLTGVLSLVADSSAELRLVLSQGTLPLFSCSNSSIVTVDLFRNATLRSDFVSVLSGCHLSVLGEGLWFANRTDLSGNASALILGTELQVGTGGLWWVRDGSSIRRAVALGSNGVLTVYGSSTSNLTLSGVMEVDVRLAGVHVIKDFRPVSNGNGQLSKIGVLPSAVVTILGAAPFDPPSCDCLFEIEGHVLLAGTTPKNIGCHVTLRGPTSSLAVLPGSVPPVLLSPVRVEGSLVLQSGSSMLLQASSSFPPGSSVDIHVNSTLSLTGPVSVQCAASPSATQAVVTVEAGSQWTVDGQLLVEQGARLVHEGSLRGNSSGVVTVQHPQSELRVSGELHNMGELRVGNGSAVVLEASSDPLTCTPFLGMRVDVEGSIAVPLSSFSHCGVAASIGARLLNVSDGGSISTQAGVQWNVDSAHVRGTLTWETSASGQVSVGGDLHLLAGSVVSGHMSVSVGGSIVIPEGGALVRGLTEAMPCVVSGTSASIGMCSVVQNGTGDSVGLSMMEGVRVGVYSRVEVSGVVQMCGPGVELADGTSHVVAGTVEVVQNSTVHGSGFVDVEQILRVKAGRSLQLSHVSEILCEGVHLESNSSMLVAASSSCLLNLETRLDSGSTLVLEEGSQCASLVSKPMSIVSTTPGAGAAVNVVGKGTHLRLPTGTSLTADLLDVRLGGNVTSFGSFTVSMVRVSGSGSSMKCVLTTDIQFESMSVLDGGRAEILSATLGPPLRYVNINGNSNNSLSISGGGVMSMEGSFVLDTSSMLLEGAESLLLAPELVLVRGLFRWLGGRISASLSSVEAGISCVIEGSHTIIAGSEAKFMSLTTLRSLGIVQLAFSGPPLVLDRATWDNPVGSTWSLVEGVVQTLGTGSSLLSAGSIVSPAFAGSISLDLMLNNTGTVTLHGGDLLLYGAVESRFGAWSLHNAATLSFLGGGTIYSGTLLVPSADASLAVGVGDLCEPPPLSTSVPPLPVFSTLESVVVNCTGSFVATKVDLVVLGPFLSTKSTTVDGARLSFGLEREVDEEESSVAVVMSGAVEVRSGVLRVSKTASVSGTLTIGSEAETRGRDLIALLEFSAESRMESFGPRVAVLRGGVLNINSDFSEEGSQLEQLRVGGSLNYNGARGMIVGSLELVGGLLSSSASVTVQDSLVWESGTILGQEPLVSINHTTFSSNGFKLLDGRELVLQGYCLWNSTSALSLNNDARVTLDDGGFLEFVEASVVSQSVNARAKLVNRGTILVNAFSPAYAFLMDLDVVNERGGHIHFLAGALRFSSLGQFNNTGGTLLLNNQTIISTDRALIISAGVFEGPGTILGDLRATSSGEIRPGNGLYLVGNFSMEDSSTRLSVFFGEQFVSFFDIRGQARFAGRMEVEVDNTIGQRPENETFTVMRYAGRGSSNFEVLGGCNGIFRTRLLAQEYQFVVVANATFTNAYVSPFGSDASCCGTQDNPCESIQFTVETVGQGRIVFLEQGVYTSRRNCQVRIGKGVTIQGRGKDNTFVDCSAFGLEAFLFNQGEGRDTVLLDFSITNSTNPGSGGGIVISNSSPTLRNMRIFSNRAAQRGGGLLVEGPLATPLFEDIIVEGNSASMGGGMFVDNGARPEIVLSSFMANTASSMGGGLYVRDASMNMTSSIVQSNVASLGGGGFFEGSGSWILFSSLENNQALQNGGGVYSLNSALQVINVFLAHNVARAPRTSEVYDIGGGALYLMNSGGLFQDCTLSKNRAAMGGAAALVNSGPLQSNSSSSRPLFERCNVFENVASSRGGGIFAFSSYFDLLDTLFSQNNATFGGALSLEQARGDALNSQLSQNVATRGGAIHMNLNAEFQDTDGVMFANEASQEGGSIYCTFCTMRLVRTVVRFSVAQRDGGSFWLSSSAVASLQDVYIVDSSVVQGNGGGVFLSVASSLTLVRGGMTRCASLSTTSNSGRGGAVYVSSSSVTLQLAEIQENVAAQGAGLYLVSANGVTMLNSLFLHNVASDQGGSLYSVSSPITSSGSSLVRNQAGSSGGAFHSIASTLHLTSDSLLENESGVGGALYMDSSEVTLTSVLMESNVATAIGGAIRSQLGELRIQASSVLTRNTATTDGGALWLESTPVSIVSSTLSKNTAPSSSGGAVYYRSLQNSALTIASSTLSENVASAGGGVFITGSLAVLRVESGTVFDSNSANSGGAVFLEGASLASFVGPLTMRSNKAVGGTDTLLVGTTGRGGGLYIRNGNSLVQNVLFDQNHATQGGGLYVECVVSSSCGDPGTTITGSTFSYNVALQSGGAFMWDNVQPRTVGVVPASSYSSSSPPSPTSSSSSSLAIVMDTESLVPNIFIGNSAPFGTNSATSGQRLIAITSLNSTVTSGRVFSDPIKIQIVDFYGNIVLSDDVSRVEAVGTYVAPFSGTVDTIGSRVQITAQGQATFDEVGVIANPGSKVALTFSTAGISQGVTLEFDVRGCGKGEFLQDRRCQLCPEGTYDLIASGSCVFCQAEGLDCSAGGSSVIAEPDYWLLIEGNDVRGFRCPSGYCRTNNETCAPGRDGVICAGCVHPLKNWGSDCLECESYNWGIIFGVFILGWAYVAAILIFSRSSSGKFKILIYFAQTVQLVLGPESSILTVFAIFNIDLEGVSESSCIGPFSFYDLSFFTILLPLIFLIFLTMCWALNLLWLKQEFRIKMFLRHLLFWFSSCKCKTSWRRSKEMMHAAVEKVDMSARKIDWNIYFHTFFFLLLFSYSTVTKSVLEFINCRDIGPYSVVASSPETSCQDSTYKSWLPLYYAVLAIFVFIGPVGLLVLLIVARLKGVLYSEKFVKRVGVLFLSYRKLCFFWETVFLARRTILIGLYVSLFNVEESRSVALSFSCIAIAAIHIAILPFESRLENLAETISLISISILSVLQASKFSSNSSEDSSILLMICLIVPVAFVVFLMVKDFVGPAAKWLKSKCCPPPPEDNEVKRLQETEGDKSEGVSDGEKDVALEPCPPPTPPPINRSRGGRLLPAGDRKSDYDQYGIYRLVRLIKDARKRESTPPLPEPPPSRPLGAACGSENIQALSPPEEDWKPSRYGPLPPLTFRGSSTTSFLSRTTSRSLLMPTRSPSDLDSMTSPSDQSRPLGARVGHHEHSGGWVFEEEDEDSSLDASSTDLGSHAELLLGTLEEERPHVEEAGLRS